MLERVCPGGLADLAGADSRGHGCELRVVKVLTVDGLGLDFPGAVQASQIMRFRAKARTGRLIRKTFYAITDLPSTQASPQPFGDLARSHWGIEDRLYFVRDTSFAEDAGPHPYRPRPDLAVDTLRQAGHQSIATALLHVSHQPFTRPLDLLSMS
ncbi:hypothetical protein [Streptomyces sp. NBC_00140]|uniref:hypothetical protein n=1 Tax=Streptomyces sp. NBC_00140 TaxID=2975664 RepID=UPI0022590857|nr:hypothetical protein [Streptomyces sp. NBC_00140]MCX5328778.1 hypothetical protein [Streptomyces sp. NBC_00140]